MDRASFLRRVGAVALALRALDGVSIEQLLEDEAPLQAVRVSLSDLDQALKNYYLPPMREMLNRQSVLFDG